MLLLVSASFMRAALRGYPFFSSRRPAGEEFFVEELGTAQRAQMMKGAKHE
jgi:hypothetical protein